MLTEKQVAEIKSHLEKAQNPLFFFDNDQDGLCSFLLLQKFIERGKGVSIKSFPDLTEEYFRKVHELNADYIFILDKPIVSEKFWEKAKQINIPVVWIDHHEVDKSSIPDFVNYYNPFYNKDKKDEPVTYLCHQINKDRKNLWLAVAGCISDKFFPDFYLDFKKDFPELSIESKSPFEILYKSKIGKIARIFGFALKDRITNVVHMIKFLINAKSPYDVLIENPKNRTMHERFNKINKKYLKFLEKARELKEKYKNLLYFQYGGDMSISSDLANQLSYEFPKKIIVVAYISQGKINISARGKNIKKIILKIIKEFKDATGGGHEEAVGAKINSKDLDKFKKKLADLVE
ncbi:hypothetical protein DRN73_03415 [Candidatus Pacearchaeota archaeon]|nr:MAG: hypothetical protein DRN73_03415 [Candidatus Pacearchaeota archaeon]